MDTKEQYERIKSEMVTDFDDFSVYSITRQVRERATRLLETNTLRGMDALHIGSAIEWHADVFVSGDKRQITAAQNEGQEVAEV